MKFVKQWVMHTALVLASQRLSIPSHSQLYRVGITYGYNALKFGCRIASGTSLARIENYTASGETLRAILRA